MPASNAGESATATEYAATSPAPNHESGGITQHRSQHRRPSNGSEAEVSFEGEGSRNDEGGLSGEEQPYDQGSFEHRHATNEPRPVYVDIRTDPLNHDAGAGSRLSRGFGG